jgi:uncharacterized membrane protein
MWGNGLLTGSLLRYVWLASFLYAVVFFALGLDKYLTYRSGADLGLFTQSISTVFGSFSNTMEDGSHFTIHFSPILYLCAPALLLFHSPLALVALQAIAGSLTAPPLFLIACKRVPERTAFAVAVAGLLYPPLVGVTFSDFHENGFAPAAVLWLIWATDARRWGAACFFLLCALSVKEDQSLFIAAANFFTAFVFRRRADACGFRFSCFAFMLSLCVFIVYFVLVRPLAGAVGPWQPLHFYGLVRVDDPKAIAPLWSFGKAAYVLEALFALAFVPLFTPLTLIAVPPFMEVLLSQRSLVWTMGQHYAGAWMGYLLAAFVFGIAALYERSPDRALACLRASQILSVLILLFASPTHWGHYLALRTNHDVLLDRVIQDLPPNIEIGTQDEMFAHMGFDPHASLGITHDPVYVLLDRTFPFSYWLQKTMPEMEREVRFGRAQPIMEEDGVILYARKRG